jgi:hypothetical protein
MALLQVICPQCQRRTLVRANGQCANVVKGGSACGFALPIFYGSGNGKYREKYEKHTTPPASGVSYSDPYSWTFASGDYAHFQEFVIASGSVHLDPRYNYLFLWTTPREDTPVANVFYGNSGTVVSATGVMLPLNSKPQNYHHFYSNYEPHFQPVADGDGLIIEPPTSGRPLYTVYRDEGGVRKKLSTYDPIAQSGQKFV